MEEKKDEIYFEVFDVYLFYFEDFVYNIVEYILRYLDCLLFKEFFFFKLFLSIGEINLIIFYVYFVGI